MVATITTPRLMAVGGGALAELPGMLQRFGLVRPLVVTDPYIRGCGILERATALLDRTHIRWEVFADTVPDPTTAVIEAGARMLAEGGFDSLVAIGGGSSIDTAKGMSVLAANGGQDARLQGPERDPEGRAAYRGDPDHRRHRLGGHALHGHHRYRNRREDADRRSRLLPAGGDRRLRADFDDAVAAHRRYRARQPDPCDRGLCQPPRQPLYRRARQDRRWG